MPVVVLYLDEAVEAGGDDQARAGVMHSPEGTRAIAAGGRPAMWDSADGETWEWFASMCSVAFILDAADPTKVNFYMQRFGGRQALKDAWISYWEDEA